MWLVNTILWEQAKCGVEAGRQMWKKYRKEKRPNVY
jgi:hypothetical protein